MDFFFFFFFFGGGGRRKTGLFLYFLGLLKFQIFFGVRLIFLIHVIFW